MGQSAGATSVAFHMLHSKGLFHTAISESNPMGVPLKSRAQAQVEGGEAIGRIFFKALLTQRRCAVAQSRMRRFGVHAAAERICITRGAV
jgi:carboxylesterase type B